MRYLCLIHPDERELSELCPTRELVVDDRAV
jgi:hypothetical protein